MMVHMWRRWRYSTFPVDESKRTVSGLVLFFLVAVQEATRGNRQRRSASRRCIQRHSSAIIACARDSPMHFQRQAELKLTEFLLFPCSQLLSLLVSTAVGFFQVLPS